MLVSVDRLVHGQLMSVLVDVEEVLACLSHHPQAGNLTHYVDYLLHRPPVSLEQTEIDVLGVEL